MRTLVEITKPVQYADGGQDCYLYTKTRYFVRDADRLKAYYKANGIEAIVKVLDDDLSKPLNYVHS